MTLKWWNALLRMCGGSQSNSEDLITLLTGLTFADRSRIHRDTFSFLFTRQTQTESRCFIIFLPIIRSKWKWNKTSFKTVSGSGCFLKYMCYPFFLTKRLKADALKRLQILMRKLQTEQVRMMQKQTLRGLAQSLPQDKSARIHTQIIHLEVKESNHPRSKIPKVVQPDLQIRLCSSPRLISLELNTKVQISIKLDSQVQC